MSEGSKENPKKKVYFYTPTVLSNSTLAIIRGIAPDFKVSIKVLAKEGEPYTYTRGIPSLSGPRGATEYKAVVPENNSRIQLSSPKENLSDFWKAVEEAKEAAKRSLANSPKA